MHQFLHSAFDVCVQFHDRHPIGTAIVSAIVVIWSLLYYLYERNLRRWTFRCQNWGSYEIEKGVRCNKAIKDGKLLEFPVHKNRPGELIKTFYECFMQGLEVSKDGPCLGHLVDNLTRYEWFSYSQVRNDARLIGKMLRSRGIQRQQCVGIYGANSCQWVIAQLGCVFQSAIAVPLYDTLGLESIRHTIQEVEMAVLFCDSEAKMKQILANRQDFPALKMFVHLNDKVQDPEFAVQCKELGVEFLTWSNAKTVGKEHSEIKDDQPMPEDIFVIQYTSGTTGVSKGVILTHSNLLGCMAGAYHLGVMTSPVGNMQALNTKDTGMMYLPMAHAYGQMASAMFFYAGGRIGITSGNVQRLFQDAQILKPTYFPLVPRIMNRMYTKVVDETKSGFKGWLFWKCYGGKKALYKKHIFTRQSIYDWLVFRKLHKILGGNVRVMTTGSAPVAAEVLEFWRVVFGALIQEAYGQTETTATATNTNDIEAGNVGQPTCSFMVRLLDLPEMGYSNDHDRPQGEICFKGPAVTQGYYKRPDLTKELFTHDGWLRTGDIGEFLPNGALRLIDRRKHIFKLSQGEYIAPEKVESVYAQCPIVAQVFVDGNSLHPYAVAIVVPEEKDAKEWAVKEGQGHLTFGEICANASFRRHVLAKLIDVGKTQRLNSLEQAKSIHLHPEMFSIQNGLLTPTMKNKRNELRRRFQLEIEALYSSGPLIATSTNRD